MLVLFLVLFLSNVVYSHGEVDEEDLSITESLHIESPITKESKLKDYTYPVVFIASLFITIFTIIALLTQNHHHHKLGLFLGIVIPIIIASVFVVYTTVYTNAISETKGPVHWHLDLEIYNCGEFVDLVSPKGMSNRVGTTLFHEHNDNRIHVEGVVVNKKDVDMHSFFDVIGGELTNEKLGAPTNNGYVEIRNGDICNNDQGKWQAFLFKVTNPEAEKEVRERMVIAKKYGIKYLNIHGIGQANVNKITHVLENLRSELSLPEEIIRQGSVIAVKIQF